MRRGKTRTLGDDASRVHVSEYGEQVCAIAVTFQSRPIERYAMAKAYFSTVFEASADNVWAAIRDFSSYEWAGVVSDVHMEEGKAGDAVGGIRNVRTADRQIRQRLLAHSDRDRFYTYELCEPVPFPVQGYEATLRVTPVTDGNRAFIEWWATFDCEAGERDRWTNYFKNDGFANWLNSLRAYLNPPDARKQSAGMR